MTAHFDVGNLEIIVSAPYICISLNNCLYSIESNKRAHQISVFKWNSGVTWIFL